MPSLELRFQQHIADFLVRVHGYGKLEQSDITDTERFIAEDLLWAFLKATQTDTLKKLTDEYGTDARDEVFKTLRKELAHTPLWMLFRHGLKVRGLELRLFYPKPRSAQSAATAKYGANRIAFRSHCYFGESNQEIDFVFFLNGLPIVLLELKHDKPERPAFTLLPRYHQSRTVRKVADDISAHFAAQADIGRKYLVHHSAGSGKTLTICWLADRLHSLVNPDTSEKLVDLVFILTDRKSLDTNIKDEIENFTHLEDIVGLARKAEDLPRFLKDRRPIIVTTQQKFAWVLQEIGTNPELKKLRVAFLIDEAHRSQGGQMGAAIRLPFRNTDEPDAEAAELDPEEQLAKVIREHDLNQMIVAFTATPAPATVALFGAAFDTYSEAEAIAEGYIVDVAASIISYKTLYHLHYPVVPTLDEERRYPKGVVSKALQNVGLPE